MAAFAAAGLGGCLGGSHYRYRYKLTLNVRDHGMLRTSSNVVQADVDISSGNTIGNSVTTRMQGDANVMQLGDGRVLVVLLTKRDPQLDGGRPPNDWNRHASPGSAILARAYGIDEYTGDLRYALAKDNQGESPFLYAITKARGARAIALSDLPTLVTFGDARDPLTVKTVDPNNLSASFGAGVTLESATIEVTDDPVSRGIERVLPWAKTLKGNLRGQIFVSDPSLPSNLDVGDFSR